MIRKLAGALAFVCMSSAFAGEPLTMNEAVRIAVQNAFDVLSARADVRRAGAVVSEAESARLPKLLFEGTYTRFTKEITVEFDPMMPPVVVRPIDQRQLRLSLQQSVDLFGIYGIAIAGARALRAASEAVLAANVDAVALRAKSAFLAVLRAEELLKVARERVANVNEQLRVARARVEAGDKPRFDVLRFESDFAAAQQDEIVAQNNVEITKANFNQVLARDISTPVELVAPPGLPLVESSLEALTEKAKEARPDVRAAAKRLEYQTKARQGRQRANLPTLNVSGNFAYDPVARGFGASKDTTSGTAVLSFPIFDGGANRARVNQARADEEKAEIALAQITLAVQREVTEAYLNVRAAEKTLETAKKNVELAQEVFRIASLRYESGVGTPLELSDANVQLVRARTSLVNAIYGYWEAVAVLQRAVGTENV